MRKLIIAIGVWLVYLTVWEIGDRPAYSSALAQPKQTEIQTKEDAIAFLMCVGTVAGIGTTASLIYLLYQDRLTISQATTKKQGRDKL